MRISDWSSDVCSSDLDAMGQGGVPGRVNQRLMKRYGSILLGTILGGSTAAIFGAEEEAVQSGSNGQQSTARKNGAIITDIVRRDIETILHTIVQRNQAVQPIITVPDANRQEERREGQQWIRTCSTRVSPY